jgi:hypothetical protein
MKVKSRREVVGVTIKLTMDEARELNAVLWALPYDRLNIPAMKDLTQVLDNVGAIPSDADTDSIRRAVRGAILEKEIK